MASLEALARQREVVHKKNVTERQRRMAKVANAIEDKQAQNDEVNRHLVTLERVLSEQERLRESMQTMEDQNSRRMRSMVTHKKLKEISSAQQSEMQALVKELERLRLRTYPTFMDSGGTVNGLPPDTKSSLWR